VKPRLEGVTILAGRQIVGAVANGSRIGLRLDDGLHVYDHVLLATGYRPDINRLRMLPRELLQRIAQVDGSSVLGSGFETTLPGLHFVGASAVASFGPLMNVIAGAGYAARSVTAAVLAQRGRREPAVPARIDRDFLMGAGPLRR
jgi:hypothetical protein